jgi:GDP-mannose 6-dehydrogenase
LETASGRRIGDGLSYYSNPEFLREGSSVRDFRAPPFTLIGAPPGDDAGVLREIYAAIDAPVHVAPIRVAESVKHISNVFHAVKLTFANEAGAILAAHGVDAREALRLLCEDRVLNISPAYLRPGFAFGGSCLPKDLRALAYQAKMHDLSLPIMNAILPSNELQVATGLRLITEKGQRKIGILGFSFKAGTDDLRESPMIEVIEHLIGKGYDLRIFDRNVSMASLVGANRDFILNRIPHISRLMVNGIDAVLNHAQTVVIGNKDPEFAGILERLQPGQHLVDFVRITNRRSENGKYDGICW